MKRWHHRDPIGFEREKEEVERAYPYLHFTVTDESEKITGSIELKEQDKVYDRFLVEVHIPHDYPVTVPDVFEVGGRVPRTQDRHCFEQFGAACVFLPEERWRAWPAGSSLLSFIDGPVRNYFVSQAVFERDGVWPLGQWEHGFYGQKQYYREMFNTDDLFKVGKYFEYLAAKKVKGHWDCPCGSGKRLRDCHMDLVRSLRDKIPREEKILAAKRLELALQRMAKQ